MQANKLTFGLLIVLSHSEAEPVGRGWGRGARRPRRAREVMTVMRGGQNIWRWLDFVLLDAVESLSKKKIAVGYPKDVTYCDESKEMK